MTRLFVNDPDSWASGYYRAKLPVLQCYSELAKEGIELHLSDTLQSNEIYYHAYMFHRMPSDNILRFMKSIKEEHKRKLVWAVDDDLWSTESWMPNSEYFNDKVRLDMCVEM